jgi:hypothetical protein
MSQRVTRILLPCLAVCLVVALGAYTLHRRHRSGTSHSPAAANGASAKLGAQPNAAANPRLKQTLEQLPLSFERRDWDKATGTRFVSSGPGYALGITKDGATLRRRFHLGDGSASVLNPEAALAGMGTTSMSNIEFTWIGASPASAPTGEERQNGYSNYFPSSDRKTWRTRVQHFGGVRLPELYKGVDLRFHGDHKELEFDYVVKAGADPNAIRLGIGTPSIVNITPEGELQIMQAGDAIRLEKPVAYQMIHGKRKDVDVKFALAKTHEARFELGDYDHSVQLVIDPVLAFSSHFGASTNLNLLSDVQLDASGNIWVTGRSCDVDYPVTPGAYQTTGGAIVSNYCDTGIVTELDPTASSLIFSTYFGTQNNVTSGIRILPEADGEVVVGTTTATNFPTTANAFQKTAAGGSCTYGPNLHNYPCSAGFVMKLTTDGTALTFSTYLGGTLSTLISNVAADSSGNLFLIGATNAPNFPMTAGSVGPSVGGGMCQGGLYPCYDGFVAKMSADGSTLAAAAYLGGNDDDFASGIALDTTGNVYVGGTAYSTNYPTTAGSYQPAHSSGADQGDAFVSKIAPDFKSFVYSTFIGGTSYDIGLGLAIDSTGAAYSWGTTASPDFPISSGAFQKTYAGPAAASTFCDTYLDSSLLDQPSCGDIFVSKLNPAGSALVYSTYIGGSQPDIAFRGALDSSKNLWLLANTGSTDFPFSPDAYYQSTGLNVVLMELSADGTKLPYATPLAQGSSGQSLALGLTLDSAGDVYVAGQATSFLTTPGQFTSGSGPAVFVAKYTTGTAAPAVTLSATTLTFPQTSVGSASQPQSVTLTNSGTAPLVLQVTMPLLIGETTAGPFSEYDNCGTTLAAGASCTINATYQPTNPQSSGDGGTITIIDNASNAPHIVQLLGTPVAIDYASFVPPTLTFNGQGPGTTSASQLSGLQSPGTSQYTIAPAPVSAPTISGPNASEFQVDSSACQIGQHYCTLNVTFTPAAGATGQRTATVSVATNAPNTPNTLSLVGNVSTGPYAVFTGPFIDPTVVGTPGNSSFAVTNTGGATLNVTAESLTGANPTEFVLQPASCTLPNFSLASGQACSISINFAPVAAGTRTATLTLVDNESKPASTVITGFAGTSTSAAFLLNIVPTLTNNVGLFPDTVVGTTGLSQFLVSVSNLGKGPGSVTSATLTGDFTQTNTCTGPVAAGNTCQYNVSFTPTTTGTRTGTLTIVTNAPGNQTLVVNFSGNGALAPQVNLAPPLMNFGPVPLNTPSGTQSATLKNTGNGTLNLSNVAITGPFTQTNTCGSAVLAGANCAFSVIFTPTASGDSGGLLSFKANAAGGFFTVALNGSGATGAVPQLTPNSLSFGNQSVGTVSPAQTVTLSNPGSAPFTFTGLQPSENFQATSNCPASIAPQASCTINVKFAPTADTYPAPFPANGAVYVSVGAKGSPLSIQTTGLAVQGTGTVNIALGSTPNPSTVGQSVTFTATVTPTVSGGPTPTGTVQFQDGGNPIGSPVTLSSGAAVLMYSALAQGNHSINVTYSGDSNYGPVASSGILQTVNASGKATTSTSVSATPNPATTGQSVKFTATVTSATAGTITGTVTFFDGATQIGTPMTLASGSASYSTTTLSQGSHSITAVYSGDTNYTTSTSPVVTQTINASGKATTTTALTSSLNPSTTGTSVTFNASVTSATSGTITGTVSFFDGATQIGSPMTLTGGAAAYTTSALAQGTHSITAVYSGDTNYSTSTSPIVSQVVNSSGAATTTTTLNASPNPSTVGAGVTLTATVTSTTTGTISGSISFYDGAELLDTPITMTGNMATYTNTKFAQGTHTLTARYNGNTNFAVSTSAPVSQVVNGSGQAATSTALTSSLNPSTSGASVTFRATVTSTTPGTISGSVSFFDGAHQLNTPITMTGNIADLVISNLSQGTHTITAVYNGNTNYAVSTSPAVSQVVNASSKAATSTAVTSSLNPSTVGASVTFTAAVTSATAGTITGTATFFDGATQLGTPATISGGMAAYTTSTLTQATHSITAQYSGDTNYAASTSSAVSQVVNAASTGDFSVSIAPTALTVKRGASGTVAVSVAPLNGSTQTVTLGCSPLPAAATCSFATPTVTLDGTHTATVMATISTSSGATAGPVGGPTSDPGRQAPLPASWQLAASLFAAIGSLALIRTSRNRAWRLALAMILLILPALSITACSNMAGGNDTGKGTYAITVTGTSGATTHGASLTLTVN